MKKTGLGKDLGDMVAAARARKDAEAFFTALDRSKSSEPPEQLRELSHFHGEVFKQLENFDPVTTVLRSLEELLHDQRHHETIVGLEHDGLNVIEQRLNTLGEVVNAICLHTFIKMRVSLAPDAMSEALVQARQDLGSRRQAVLAAKTMLAGSTETESLAADYLQAFIDERIAAAWFEHLQTLSQTPLQN